MSVHPGPCRSASLDSYYASHMPLVSPSGVASVPRVALSTQYRLLSTQYSVLSTGYSCNSRPEFRGYSVLGTPAARGADATPLEISCSNRPGVSPCTDRLACLGGESHHALWLVVLVLR